MNTRSATLQTAIDLFQQRQEVSVELLQRHFRIGTRAATELMEKLEHQGIVSALLPEGFRVLRTAYRTSAAPKVPTERDAHAQRVFETALYLVEMIETDGGNGHSEAFKQIKPSHIEDWAVCRRVSAAIKQSDTNSLLDVCALVAGLSGEGCTEPAYAFGDISETLSSLCNWWSSQALQRAPEIDLREFRYEVSLLRQARYLYRIYKDAGGSGGGWSRFDIFVDESQTPRGTSHRWEGAALGQLPSVQDEHVVPLAFIRDHCIHLYELGASISQVAGFIRDHLVIVHMLKTESQMLDATTGSGGHGWKTTMPKGWRPGVDSIFARLHAANIGFTPPLGFLL